MIIDKYIEILVYENLFLLNKNLNGKNVNRAIRDFEGILKYIEKDHAIAHYCLARAYRKKGDNKTFQKHMNKVVDILADPINIRWTNYFDLLVPKNEMNELKTLLT